MIRIRSLTALDRDRFHELSGGYASSEKYEVEKRESYRETIIAMRLQRLERPYVKVCEPEPVDDMRYEKIIQEGLSAGAYDDERLIGIAIAEKQAWNRTLWIWEFHIDTGYRGRGIGRQLMEHMASIGRSTGCRVILCETQSTNVPAIQFYRKVGFEVGGIDLSYYTNKDASEFEVAIFMKRYLE